MHWLLSTPPQKIFRAIRTRVLPNLKFAGKSRLRRCRCCEHYSLFLQFSSGEEFRFCLFCRSNLRYEMLAEYIRDSYSPLDDMDVVELDRGSPLRPILSGAETYRRTFYSTAVTPGTPDASGATMEDVTRLTFKDSSVDLLVSSEVLEHVPDLHTAFGEFYRVLRPGGAHVFTVPPHDATRQLAAIDGGQIRQLIEPPEYHGDPLGVGGILAFWHLGPDFPEVLGIKGFKFSIVKGPEGLDRRIVWCAQKVENAQ
jgi:SAM-dependent methyltransferase